MPASAQRYHCKHCENRSQPLTQFFLDAGLTNPLEKNFEIVNFKRGIARELGRPPKQMLPITCEILLAIRNCLRLDNSRDISFWAACCVAFYGFLRKSTLLPESSVIPGDDCILRKDLHMTSSNRFVLYIRKTKTIQFGQRIIVVPYTAAPIKCILCPVAAISSLLSCTSYKAKLPLFLFRKNSSICFWTLETFAKRLRELLKRIGKIPAQYSCHSFRRGGASFAFQIGMSLVDIMQRGDWASDAVLNYIFMNQVPLNHVADKLVGGAAYYVT